MREFLRCAFLYEVDDRDLRLLPTDSNDFLGELFELMSPDCSSCGESE